MRGLARAEALVLQDLAVAGQDSQPIEIDVLFDLTRLKLFLGPGDFRGRKWKRANDRYL